MKICYRCHKEVAVQKIVGRKDVCLCCGSELRCCLNCRFYSERAYKQCGETQAERILDKARSNFCDYFVFKDTETDQMPEGKQTSRDKLESLFK